MLVLSRKFQDSIIIGVNTKVQVVKIEPDVVKLGIQAPYGVPVNREEIFHSKLEEGSLETPRKVMDALTALKRNNDLLTDLPCGIEIIPLPEYVGFIFRIGTPQNPLYLESDIKADPLAAMLSILDSPRGSASKLKRWAQRHNFDLTGTGL